VARLYAAADFDCTTAQQSAPPAGLRVPIVVHMLRRLSSTTCFLLLVHTFMHNSTGIRLR
jgi:hypothetical protein